MVYTSILIFLIVVAALLLPSAASSSSDELAPAVPSSTVYPDTDDRASRRIIKLPKDAATSIVPLITAYQALSIAGTCIAKERRIDELETEYDVARQAALEAKVPEELAAHLSRQVDLLTERVRLTRELYIEGICN